MKIVLLAIATAALLCSCKPTQPDSAKSGVTYDGRFTVEVVRRMAVPGGWLYYSEGSHSWGVFIPDPAARRAEK